MTNGRRAKRGSSVVAFGLVLFGLSACQPEHSSDDVQIKIYSDGDGRAALSVENHAEEDSGAVIDESAFLGALTKQLAIGEVVGPADVPPDRGSSGPAVQLEGVNRTKLRVPMATVLSVMDQFGLSGDATVFVSLCTSALKGTASGDGVGTFHRSSCATWEPFPRPTSTRAFAELTFGDRSAPSGWPTWASALIAMSGIASAAVFFRGSRRFRKVGETGALVGVLVSLVITGWTGVSGVLLNDPFLDTGQTFRDGAADGLRTAMIVALVAGVVAPTVLLVVGGRTHRRSAPDGSAATPVLLARREGEG